MIEFHDPAGRRGVSQKCLEGRDEPVGRRLGLGNVEQRFPVEALLEFAGRLILHAAAQRGDVAAQHAKGQHHALGCCAKFQRDARVRPHLKRHVDERSARGQVDKRYGWAVGNANRCRRAQLARAETRMDSPVAPAHVRVASGIEARALRVITVTVEQKVLHAHLACLEC
jgi:hypothetical protein